MHPPYPPPIATGPSERLLHDLLGDRPITTPQRDRTNQLRVLPIAHRDEVLIGHDSDPSHTASSIFPLQTHEPPHLSRKAAEHRPGRHT
jgi:hypothetical protein